MIKIIGREEKKIKNPLLSWNFYLAWRKSFREDSSLEEANFVRMIVKRKKVI